MKEIAIILGSHGYFAKEALASVEMIMGQSIENIGILSVVEGKDYETMLKEAQALKASLDTSAGLLILVDIYGGTPANVATYMAIEDPNIVVYSGFNLPILLELMYQRTMDINAIKQNIEDVYKMGLTCITDKLKEREEDGDQMDSY